ncbi:MAG: sulfatase [Rikenellaceae bacterium]
MKRASTLAVALAAFSTLAAAERSDRPNIIWFLTEDLSPQYLALYNEGKGAATPNVEAMAQNAIIYNNAFSNAPVSSAARTTLITGCYAPRFGGSFHRRITPKPMPEGLNMFPSYLRASGYYTCNAKKTDYNVVLDDSAWSVINGEMGDWRKREDKDQPFFFVRSTMVTHESKLLFDQKTYEDVKTKTPLESVYLHPNLPDTDLVRYTYATFYDRIAESDEEFGKMIEMLREDGLLENTIIFFMGDNGGALPESKGYTDDTGLRVPLMLYVPEQWREELAVEVNRREDGMVSFMDMGATTLNIAGLEIPEQMDGRPFVGKGSSTRNSVVCYGDRFDDLYAFNRVLYRGNFRYSRNYIPYHTQGQHSFYRYKSLAFQQARQMYHAGELDALQSVFFEPFGVEELYDLSVDPNETNNLANDPKYLATLEDMRNELSAKVEEYCDLGFIPENVIIEEGLADPAAYGLDHQEEIAIYRYTADLQLIPYNKARNDIYKAITSSDDVENWWGITSLVSHRDHIKGDKRALKAVSKIVEGENRAYLKMRAYVALAELDARKLTEAELKGLLKAAKNEAEVTLILNDATHLKESGLLAKMNLTESDTPYTSINIEPRLEYISE